MLRSGIFEHHEQAYFIGAASATPAASGVVNAGQNGACPQGYVWYVEIANFHVGGTHNALVELAVQTAPSLPAAWDRATRVWSFGAAAVDGAQAFPNGIYVPAGSYLIANFTAGSLAQNDVCTLNVQIAWHQLTGGEIPMSRQDVRQVGAAHFNPPHAVAESATAEHRATDNPVGEDLHVVDPDPFVGSPG